MSDPEDGGGQGVIRDLDHAAAILRDRRHIGRDDWERDGDQVVSDEGESEDGAQLILYEGEVIDVAQDLLMSNQFIDWEDMPIATSLYISGKPPGRCVICKAAQTTLRERDTQLPVCSACSHTIRSKFHEIATRAARADA